MTGADNSDSLFKESPAMKRLKKMDMKWFNSKNARKKPKVIPKGFVWNPKAKELVDVRCNNPKLKKLCRESVRVDVKLKKKKGSMISTPAICISPFYTTHDTGPLMSTIETPKKKQKKHKYDAFCNCRKCEGYRRAKSAMEEMKFVRR